MKTKANTKKLRQLRESRGWSQSQLSEMSHISLRTIQRMEKDGRCGIESLKSVAAVFDIDFKELQAEKKHMAYQPNAATRSLLIEYKKIWLRTRFTFWALNFSMAFLVGCPLLFFDSSLLEIAVSIVGLVLTEILTWHFFGGYETVKKRFIQKHGNVFEE